MMKTAVAMLMGALVLTGCAGRMAFPDYPAMPIFAYDATKAPAAANKQAMLTKDDGLRVVADYVHQTRHWADSEFRIKDMGASTICTCRNYNVDYLPDIALTPKGIMFTGGYPNTFVVAIDSRTGSFVREYIPQ